jgi:hypothetical protein
MQALPGSPLKVVKAESFPHLLVACSQTSALMIAAKVWVAEHPPERVFGIKRSSSFEAAPLSLLAFSS